MKFYIIPDKNNIKECIDIANEYGFGFEYNDFYAPNILDNKEMLDSIIANYKSLNRKEDYMHGAFFDICLNSSDHLIKEISEKRIIQSLEIATQLDLKGVIFHTNYINWMTGIKSYCDKWINDNAEFYKKIALLYPNINIFIENMFDNSPYLLKQLMEKINLSNVKVCLDLAHAFISKTDINTWILELKDFIGHIHINDNDGVNDLHLEIGKGKMDVSQIWGAINNLDVTVLIEISDLKKALNSYFKIMEMMDNE